jgi:hypothetical protein
MVAGLIGGAAGQFLFLQFASGSGALDLATRVVGWTLLGSLAGVGLAFFVPNLRSDKGLLGGAVGGATGALGFQLITLFAQDLFARVAGAALLGLGIGLMVAWAERLFRKAWLEVRYGGGEKRDVNLGATAVSIGSDAQLSTVYVGGVPPVAFRYRFEGGRVMCEDATNGHAREMKPGETQAVGRVTVVVCTADTSVAPAEPDDAVLALPDEVAPLPKQPSAEVVTAVRPKAPEPVSVPAPPPIAAQRPVAPPPVIPSSTVAPPVIAPPKPVPPPAPVVSKPVTSEDACPGCGRKAPGRPGTRYCMICDRTF